MHASPALHLHLITHVSSDACLPVIVLQASKGNDTQHCNACRYPNNVVLRLLTPQDTCRPLDIYPVKLTQDAIYVDVGSAASSRAYQTTRGGADSSIERNNVYALQPKSYIQGQDPSGDKPASVFLHRQACCGSSQLTIACMVHLVPHKHMSSLTVRGALMHCIEGANV